ncbi:transcriptional regulator, TetR family [Oribacterium sp. oral taxon 078 str. F0263]|uniref:TetR/AcrR family transcriptional regulator n=1 Tax=Oribacterium sp. oral taxon 078 TaxID=652706 RepID=UPI0003AE2237|nr:TetR/AcrR family transcriptional regulator [Oribacterium sp. oral taxon 078]ERL21391.1 transcriptional regulator, TetR family [Oribacterium sp. oral taxon 078 str. F0263]
MENSETKKKIREVGKREFLKKGFKEASLNHIVAEAGFTKGAFYGYYADKAALFEDLVSSAAEGLVNQFKAAQEAHFDLIPENQAAQSRELSTQYLRHFLDYIYEHFDAFKLILCCADGTKYENYIHDLVELDVARTEQYFTALRNRGRLKGDASPELHHMITSAYFTAVFETVVHDMPREKAVGYIEELAVFFNSGWDGLLRMQ